MSKVLGTWIEVEKVWKDRNNWEQTEWVGKLVEDEEAADRFIETVKSNLNNGESIRRKDHCVVVECDCGEQVHCYSNTNECDNCEELYNRFGQQLAPRDQWGWETGERPEDLYNM